MRRLAITDTMSMAVSASPRSGILSIAAGTSAKP